MATVDTKHSKDPAAPSNGTQNSLKDITQRNIETVAKMRKAAEGSRTFGQHIADGFAAVVGSWTFIIVQSVLLIIWMAFNLAAWSFQWDPYPFILLNLALSFQAAFASPIIMMSQNRQSEMADKRNHLDLQINLLAEEENTEMLRLLRKLCEHVGVDASSEGDVTVLEQKTRPEEIADQIDSAAAENPPPTRPKPATDPNRL